MLWSDHDELFDGLDAGLEVTSSRRSMMKRLAALGLVAAGGLSLAPLAKAKPKRGGGGGLGAQEVPVPDPIVRPTLWISRPPRNSDGAYEVNITGTIQFGQELSALMAAGRQFRLYCQIEGDDNRDPDAGVLIPKVPGGSVFTIAYQGAGTAPRPFRWHDWVNRAKLDEDRGSAADELVARIYWSTKAPGASRWSGMRRSNGMLYWQSPVVQKVI